MSREAPAIRCARLGATRKIIGIGLNYHDHAAELGVAAPAEPIVFLEARSSIIGPYDDIEIPSGCTQADWEVEMRVVIGSRLRSCAEPRAHVGQGKVL